MKMTLNNLRLAIGLKPHDVFEYEQLLHLRERMSFVPFDVAVRERFRCTGRTTEMLLLALHDVLTNDRRVLIVANSLTSAQQMHRTIMQWLHRLQVEPIAVSQKAIMLSDDVSMTFVHAGADEINAMWDVVHRDHVVEGTL